MKKKRCNKCSYVISVDAKFCNRCGAPVEMEVPTRTCESCREIIQDKAHFCTSCGHKVLTTPIVEQEDSLIEGPEINAEISAKDNWITENTGCDESYEVSALPPRRLSRRSSQKQAAGTADGFPKGSLIADIGAVIALVGCFLPLMSGVGENTAIIPSISNEISYAYILPLSAIILAIMAWGGTSGKVQTTVMNGGGVIALSSPWSVFFILAILSAKQLANAFGMFSFTDIGIGLAALALGFTISLIGGFVMLQDATKE